MVHGFIIVQKPPKRQTREIWGGGMHTDLWKTGRAGCVKTFMSYGNTHQRPSPVKEALSKQVDQITKKGHYSGFLTGYSNAGT